MSEQCGIPRPDLAASVCTRPASHQGSHLVWLGGGISSVWDDDILLVNQPYNGISIFRSVPLPPGEDTDEPNPPTKEVN